MLHFSRRMQNEAVAPTILFTIVHDNTELCCVIEHCLKTENVTKRAGMNSKERNYGAEAGICTTLPRKYFHRKRVHRSERTAIVGGR